MSLFYLLLFPQLNFNLYVSLIIFLTLVNLIRFNKDNLFGESVKLFLPFYILFLIVIIVSCIRYLVDVDSIGNFKDILDGIRLLFFPAVYICLYGTSRKVAIKVVILFFLLDFVISNFQFFRFNYLGIVDFVFSIYNYPSIRPWVYGDYGITRAPGLFSGFGEHGLFMFFFILFIYANIRFINKYFVIILFLLALEVLFINQSRTIIVSLGLVLAFYWTISFLSFRNLTLNILMLVVIAYSLFLFSSELSYLASILDSGLEAGAMTSRFEKWNHFMSYWTNPAYLVFGAGREIVGNQTVYDNEFVYMITTFGLLVSILYYFFVVRIMTLNGMLLCSFCYLMFLTISGLGIISISQPQLVVFLTLFYCSKNSNFIQKG